MCRDLRMNSAMKDQIQCRSQSYSSTFAGQSINYDKFPGQYKTETKIIAVTVERFTASATAAGKKIELKLS